MSHLYKEWQDIVREYMERQQVDPYTYHPDRKPTEFVKPRPPSEVATMYDRLTEESKRLNKEYALQLSNSVGQNNGEKQNDK